MITYRRVDTYHVPADAVVVVFMPTGRGVRAAVVWKGEGAGLEPLRPEQALFEAQIKAVRLGLKHVVVHIEDRSYWDNSWGELVEAAPEDAKSDENRTPG